MFGGIKIKDRVNEYDEISLIEMFNVLKKNICFIVMMMVVGLITSLGLSLVQDMRNPVTQHYRAGTTIELVNAYSRENQPQVVLNVIQSPGIKERAINYMNLSINAEDFTVTTEKSIKVDQYDIIVEGPNLEDAIILADAIVVQTQNIIEGSMYLSENRVVERAHDVEEPIDIPQNTNYILNIGIGIIAGLMLSIFLIFFIRFLNNKVQTEADIEAILNKRVYMTFPSRYQEKLLSKFFKVQ